MPMFLIITKIGFFIELKRKSEPLPEIDQANQFKGG